MNPICLSSVASWIILGCRIPSWHLNVFNTRLTIDKRVAGCRVIIGCRRRLKQSSGTADSLVISFWLNENHGLNPSKGIRKMWAHYWCPLTGWRVRVRLSFFSLRSGAKSVDSPLPLRDVDLTFDRCQQHHWACCFHFLLFATVCS